MLDYYLYLNSLTEAPNDCVAKPAPIRVLTREDLIKECCKEGTGITPYEAEGLFKRLETVITESLENGYSINTPLVNISPSITGVFDDFNDSFDGNRHKLRFKATPGVLLKKSAENTRLQKIDRKKSEIDIYSFVDHNLEKETNLIKSGNLAEIKGKKLKLDPTDDNQGIFFVAEDGTEHRVSVYAKNTDGTQVFQIPDGLEAGDYELVIRNIPNNSKKLYSGSFDKKLTVKA
ncbi:DNA-binding domain-containing protein [Marinifilum fragile]|jgi:hypothetical protein|uniref:DNA-binding domain-containing protein n=1 Tax=Marinifilum fragile TaxID=570161 RepID=UPI002AA8A83C|nr:DNA-binding domain-containing protein [Marinifilum fragile]